MLPRQAPAGGGGARISARTLTARTAIVFAAAALLAGAAGCGGDDEGERGDAPAPFADRTELTVTVYPAGPEGPPPETAEVRCPADATPETEACEATEALPDDAAAPVPPGAVCTQIYGGPDVVQIEGTLRGEDVATELTRENGCEIDRFDRFRPLLRALFDGYRPGRALEP